MFNLNGKNIVITGATGGIGSAIAKVFYNQGANLLLTGTKEDKLAQFSQTLGERAHKIRCDLSNISEVESLLDVAVKVFGSIDGLICNAGITKDTLAIKMSNADFSSVINVNLESTFVLNRNFIRHMIKNRKGRIINISSVVAFSGNPGQANYCASKAGMVGMSKALAREVASRNVTVNCIAPGFVRTAMTDSLTEEQKARVTGNIPAGQIGESEDIAYAALYLMSDESRYVTGQTIHVNGGMLMV